MIQIFTSYFAKARQFSPEKYLVVSISRFSPRGWTGTKCPVFAPSPQLLHDYKAGMDKQDYVMCYRSEMGQIKNMRDVFARLSQLAKGRDIILCCYEKTGDFCHRHILTDIVFEKYGYRINEL